MCLVDKVCCPSSSQKCCLQAWPLLFPTGSTFFCVGLRVRHFLQAETYNLVLPGPLSNRINWCAKPLLPCPHGQEDTCTCIPPTHPTPKRHITYLLWRLSSRREMVALHSTAWYQAMKQTWCLVVGGFLSSSGNSVSKYQHQNAAQQKCPIPLSWKVGWKLRSGRTRDWLKLFT